MTTQTQTEPTLDDVLFATELPFELTGLVELPEDVYDELPSLIRPRHKTRRRKNFFPSSLLSRIMNPPCHAQPERLRVVDGNYLERRCGGCNIWLPVDIDHFAKQAGKKRRSITGFGTECLPCAAKRSSAHRKAHPAIAYAQHKRRRARDKDTPGTLTAADELMLMAEAGNACLCCRSTLNLEFDHIIPPGQPGSSHAAWNRQVLCHTCNSHKSTSTTDYRRPYAGRIQ